MKIRSVVLIGEAPGKSSTPDTHSPLFPHPANSAGARLHDLTGISKREYIDTHRVNLIPYPVENWDAEHGRWAARGLIQSGMLRSKSIVLLGEKVREAFRIPKERDRFTWYDIGHDKFSAYALVPHPSGLNRIWNQDGVKEEARRFFKETFRPG